MARKKLNKNLVVALSLCGFAAMILLSVLMLQQLAQRDPKYFVEKAENAIAAKDWRQAAAFYQQAWERSNDPRHLVAFGDAVLRDGDVQNARLAWMKALIQDPTLIDGHTKQLQLLLRQAQMYSSPSDWESVRDAAKAMLAAASEGPPAAMAHHALGLSLIELRDRGSSPDEGLEHILKACEIDPKEVQYSIDLAEEYHRRDMQDKAQAVFTSVLTQHAEPGSAAAKARTAYGQYLVLRGKSAEAEEFFKQAITFAGDDKESRREARIGYAGYLMQNWTKQRRSDPEKAQALYDAAQETINQAIADDPNNFSAYIQLANLYRLSGEYAKVVDVCEMRIRKGLDRKGVEATQDRLSTFTLMTYASEASIALSIESAGKGDLAARDKWLDRADQYVTDARGEAPTHPMVLSQSGRVRIARGQERAGLEDLRASDEAYRSFGRTNWENRLIRARVHLQLNEPGAARTVLEEVLSEAIRARLSDPLFWNLYAQSLVQVGDMERAMSVVDRILASAPNNKDAIRIKAAIYERQGNEKEAGIWEEKLSGSGSVRAILEARAAVQEGNTEKAIELLNKAMEDEPGDARIVATLAGELAQLGRQDEARRIVAKALNEKPDDDVLKAIALSLREGLTQEDRERELLRLIESEEDDFKKCISLVAYYSRLNDPAKVLEAIDKAEAHIAAADTDSAKRFTALQHAAILRTKVRAAAQLNNEAAMAKARDDAVRLNVDGADGKSILGLYHFLRKEFALAAQAFEAALVSQPTHVASWIMLGQCLQVLGRNDESQNAFAKAAEVNPHDGAAHQGLALLAQMRGDTATFQKELAIAEKLLPDDPWIREQVLIRTEAANPAEAIARREQQLAQKEEPGNLQRLAELYVSVGQQDKADRAYARLLELQPNDARIALAAAKYYRSTGRNEQAVTTLSRFAAARSTAEEKASAATMVAAEQLEQGHRDLAKQTLLDAAQIATTVDVGYALGNFYLVEEHDPAKAIPWFDKAVVAATGDQARQLPALMERRIVCLLDRALNDTARAREEAAAFRRRFPDDPRGYLIQSEVEARAGEIGQAISSLTEYLARRPNDVYALTQRANHQIALGRLAQASEDLERIKQSSSASIATPARILLARIHEREGRADRALAELEALARESGSFQANHELVGAYIRRRQFADADRIATAMINASGQKPDPQWFFLRGQVSLELKDYDKALADFRRGAELAGHSPAAVGAVLKAYITTGQFAQGVQYFDGLGSREERDTIVLGAYGQLLARAGRTPQSIEVFRRAMSIAMAGMTGQVQELMGNVIAAFPEDSGISQFEQAPCTPELTRANQRILARLLAVAKQYPQACAKLDALKDTAADDRERSSLLYEKGEILQLASDVPGALAAYTESLKFAPDNWLTLNNMAYLLSELNGQHETALVHARSAVTYADNPYTLDTLGWIYTNLNRFDEAIAELNRAVRLDPEYVHALYHLGETYRRAGRFDEATAVLNVALQTAKAQNQSELVGMIETSIPKASSRQSEP